MAVNCLSREELKALAALLRGGRRGRIASSVLGMPFDGDMLGRVLYGGIRKSTLEKIRSGLTRALVDHPEEFTWLPGEHGGS
jgi:hypothetical protein